MVFLCYSSQYRTLFQWLYSVKYTVSVISCLEGLFYQVPPSSATCLVSIFTLETSSYTAKLLQKQLHLSPFEEIFEFIPNYLAHLFKDDIAEHWSFTSFQSFMVHAKFDLFFNTDVVLENCLVFCHCLLWHCSVSAVLLRITFLLSWVFRYRCSISKYVFSISTCQSIACLKLANDSQCNSYER